MSSYLGSHKIDDFLTFTVNTHMPTTGAETDADAVPTYRIYEDETATPIVTGSMALLDAANTDGFYSEEIQLTAASGFEKGKSYNIRVNGVVSTVAASTILNFQIEAEVSANITRISGTVEAADDLEASALTIVRAAIDDTAFTPTNTTFETDITEATADHFNGRVIIFTSGSLKDQATSISDYVLVGGRGKFTVVALTEAPADGDAFVIV